MIRRACAANIGKFATKLEKQQVITELLPVFRQLSSDEQDAIRVLCIESLIPLAAYMSKEENNIHVLGSILAAGEDKSWKVRLCFAKNFARFAEAVGMEITDGSLIQTFNLLLDENESEPEVRNAAIQSLPGSLAYIKDAKFSMILKTLQSCYSEAQVQFKAGVANALCDMAEQVGKSTTNDMIVPIINELIKDDSSEVRLNMTANLHKVGKVLGPDFLTPVMITILENLTKDSQWRVQSAAYKLMGDLIISLNKTAYDKLFKFFMSFLTQPNASVRKECVEKFG